MKTTRRARDDAEALDRGLVRMHGTCPEYAGGNSNHGPMAAEALAALGHPERIAPFLDGYAPRLDPLPTASPREARAEPPPLGDFAQVSAWVEYFTARLASGDPFAVVASSWAQLATGYGSAAFHGVLRAAHAVRALAERDTSVRRRELAHGLGYWASRHVLLPGAPGARAVSGLDVVGALDRVPMVPADQRISGGLITRRLTVLADLPGFASAVEAVDLDVLPVDEAVTALCAAAARLYLATPSARFVYLHGLTGSSALRLLLPYLAADQQRTGLGYLFQAVAALHATHGEAVGVPTEAEPTTADLQGLRDRAAASSDDHTIKVVEAALREFAVAQRPEFLGVAASRFRD